MTTENAENQTDSYTEVYVWGGDHHGQLGLGKKYIGKSYPNPRICSFNLIIKEVSCGEEHSAFITMRGHIYTMGSNSEGRLGVGNRAIRQSSSPCLVEDLIRFKCVQISCGWGHTVAVVDNGEAYSWGVGEHGALGIGSTKSEWSPAKVNLDDKVFIGVSRVSCGSRHTALISEFGNLYMCGAGDAGQLGTGKREKEVNPVQIAFITEKVVHAACGIFHSLILTERGKVFATGGNTFGQLGTGNKKNTNIPLKIKDLDSQFIVKVACGHHSAALTDSGEIYLWGTGVFGEFCSPTRISQSGARYKDIDVGSFFGAATEETGLIWTWGSNTSGELGLADYEPRKSPFPNMALQGKAVSKLSCGGSYVIALGDVIESSEERRSQLTSPTHALQGYKPNFFSKTPMNSGTSEKVKGFSSVNRRDNPRDYSSRQFHDLDGTRERVAPNGREKEAPRFLKETMERHKSPYRKTENFPREDPSEKLMHSKSFEHEEDLKQPMRSSKIDDPFVDLLLKQKNLLESNLKLEKDEKRHLESALNDSRRRLKELKGQQNELDDLQNTVTIQGSRFDELKMMYDDECRKSHSLYEELAQERQHTKVVENKNNDLLSQIEEMQKGVNEVEGALQRRNLEVEDLRSVVRKQVEKNRDQGDHHAEEKAKLEAQILELTDSLQANISRTKHLEESRIRDYEEKEVLEKETMDLGGKMAEFMDRLDDAMAALEKEQAVRSKLEEKLQNVHQREQDQSEQNELLKEELQTLRSAIEKNLEAEHENNTRMLDEHEKITKTLYAKEEEAAELKDRIKGLEQDLTENLEKNEQLVGLLNQEIDRQAEEYKQRTLGVLMNSPSRSLDPERELNDQRDRSGRLTSEMANNRSLGYQSSPIGKKRAPQQQDQAERWRDGQDHDSGSGAKLEDRTQVSGHAEATQRKKQMSEEQRRRIRTSADKLADILDIQRKDDKIRSANRTVAERDETFQRVGRKPATNYLDRSDVKRSPSRNTEEYLNNLSEVKDRLTTLQRNKSALETKMKDFEQKLKNINKP